MENFNFNSMSDDEFRREFLRILNIYKSGMDGYMKEFYGGNNNLSNDIGRVNEDDIFGKLFGKMPEDLNIERGTDENGNNWESTDWMSPDGLSNFRSYRRHYFGDMMGNPTTTPKKEVSTVDLLKQQLHQAVEEERYENAKDIHELIEKMEKDKKQD